MSIAAETPPPPAKTTARIALVTGIDYPGHKWEETSKALMEELAKDKRLKVEVRDGNHPITKGLEPFEVTDELYTCLAGETKIRILETAKSVVDKKDYAMAFVLEFGKGRVFNTPLGHDAQVYHTPGVARLMRRAVAWTAGLPVIDIPADQPVALDEGLNTDNIRRCLEVLRDWGCTGTLSMECEGQSGPMIEKSLVWLRKTLAELKIAVET